MTDKYRLFITALLLFFISIPAFSQDSEDEEIKPQKIELYTLGDHSITISAGIFIPMFMADPTPNGSSTAKTNLKVGGRGYLAYDAYLSNNIKAGFEVGGIFANGINKDTFFMVPILGKFSYEFHFGQFSMPIYIGTGVNIITYKDMSNVEWILKPGISLFWNFNTDWSFGANLAYWFAPEIISADHTQDRIGNYLDFTISAQYHF